MEPVWMTLGEASGVAAAMALQGDLPVQQVDTAKLRSKLRDLGVKVERPASTKAQPA
jgi:hypothetical protein